MHAATLAFKVTQDTTLATSYHAAYNNMKVKHGQRTVTGLAVKL